MTRRPQPETRWPQAIALAGLVILAFPQTRRWMEADMTTHMLVQYPLIALAGFLLAPALPSRSQMHIHRWNVMGINGLFATALVLALLMIPRLLDLALVDGRVELAKWLALLVGGTALRLSWRPAGLLVQGFFLGNVLPMMAVVGSLYASSPVRVCNAYLLDDQERLGQWLVWISAVVALVWLAWVARTLMQREDAALTSLTSDPDRADPASR